VSEAEEKFKKKDYCARPGIPSVIVADVDDESIITGDAQSMMDSSSLGR